MMKQTCFFILFFSMSLCSQAAEMRVWEDKDGNRYRGAYIREMFDKVTLRTGEGEDIRIAVENLSEHDQKYLRVMVPPEMEVEVKTDTRPRSKEFDDQYDQDNDITEFLTATVQIRKKSQRPFTSRLKAELFLIAEEVQERNCYILLSKTESSFLLGSHNDDQHTFTTKPVTLMVYTEWTRERRGPNYIGYVLAISDVEGDVVQVDTNIDWLADKVPELQELYARGAASRYSRYFDKETVRKRPVPRPSDFPGRM